MLELIQVSRQERGSRKDEPQAILEGISLSCPAGQMIALVGPTGSGKTALLETLAQVSKPDSGTMLLSGVDLGKTPLDTNHIGFVPSSADALLPEFTVQETLVSSGQLRIAGIGAEDLNARVTDLLGLIGLETLAQEKVSQLSLSQKRRLLLGTALITNPLLVVCDDLITGVDAKSERELLATLKMVARDHPDRVVVHASRSLSSLPAFNTVALLYEGRICFHGPARALPHYLSVKTLEDTYPRLAMRPAQRWADSWARHRDSYYDAFKMHEEGKGSDHVKETEDVKLPRPGEDGEEAPPEPSEEDTPRPSSGTLPAAPPMAGFGIQTSHLIRRRWAAFRRNRRDWILQALSVFGLPVLALFLVWPVREQWSDLGKDAQSPGMLIAAHSAMMAVWVQMVIVLFQALRNGSRELAPESGTFHRETVGGLRLSAYLISKLAFLGPLVLLQVFCLVIFVGMAVQIPVPGSARLGLFLLSGLAFTSLCLGISAHCQRAERARAWTTLLFVGQILLSGALLRLPNVLGSVVHPLITGHAGWAGSVGALEEAPLLESIQTLSGMPFPSPGAAAATLLGQTAFGLVLIYSGLRRQR